jgi:hypothetical protein
MHCVARCQNIGIHNNICYIHFNSNAVLTLQFSGLQMGHLVFVYAILLGITEMYCLIERFEVNTAETFKLDVVSRSLVERY